MSHENTLLTTQQVASRLGVSVSQINRLAAQGRIQTVLKGPGERGPRFFTAAAVLEYMEPAK